MKIDMTQQLITYDGKPVKDDEGAVTLRRVCGMALTGQAPQDNKLSGDDKMKRFLLAKRAYEHDYVSLSAEELVTIKKAIADSFTPAVMGPAWLLLDPPEDEGE